MPQEINITIDNKLRREKRGINVYHHSTKGAHIISHESSLTIPLKTTGENDYLHISLVSGPGNLWQPCYINIPSWADFEFSTEVKVAITHFGAGTILKIQPGPPSWQLKMTRPAGVLPEPTIGKVTITDNEEQRRK
ncbi:MAG: hypothetical protein KAW12_00860 [Candidatus Aminicenantes bacterium]|nr:hypothetical protein [Candidatus Aminicenantes bacterium]